MNIDLNILRPFLLQRGFSITEETPTRLVFEHKGVYVSAVDQRFDGLEVWLSDQQDKGGIRIGFLLEYFLVGKVDLSKMLVKNPDVPQAEKNKNIERYTGEFIKRYYDELFDDPQSVISNYRDWQKETNNNKVTEIVALLHEPSH